MINGRFWHTLSAEISVLADGPDMLRLAAAGGEFSNKMKLVITFEHRFYRTPDGRIWTHASYTSPLWNRYLDVFDQVQVIARALEVEAVPPNCDRADCDQVSFVPLSCYIGPRQFLLHSMEIRKKIRSSLDDSASFIIRVPSTIGTLTIGELGRRGHPYGLEVNGDPNDVFAPGMVSHPLRPVFRWWSRRNLTRQCAAADAASYVTEHALQNRYPCPAFSVGISDVVLPEEAFVGAPRRYPRSDGVFNLVFVGSLAQKYKAPHVLIDAVAACVRGGLNLQLYMAGEGKHRGELEARASRLGLTDKVIFLGQVQAGSQVREQLSKADLFVLPSFTEGMPRALLEAMAQGLPCIGTSVGGIPELLPEEDMVPPGDAPALAEKIQEVLEDPARLSRMARRNLDKSRQYSEEILQSRRVAFHRYLSDVTQAWLSEERP